MKTIVVLLRKLHRIGHFAAALEQDPTKRGELMTELIDEVMGYIALEVDVLVPVAAGAVGYSARLLQTTHVRARLALFRLATQWDGAAFRGEMATLRDVFRAHALALSRVLNELHDALGAKEVEDLDRAILAHPAAAERSAAAAAPGLAHTVSGVNPKIDVPEVA